MMIYLKMTHNDALGQERVNASLFSHWQRKRDLMFDNPPSAKEKTG